MKVTGIVILLAGIFFILYSFFSEPDSASSTVSWAPWIGLLVLITGGISYFKARKEDTMM
ncbi:LPXTG cell wall anchor domain-containing protein [Rhodohalobacter mucosus]|uniref:Uncharacterized protein n=1 Tax=Rhodohalobacter mucosus TaxID=2079485 RepID=A0A316TTP0_9BACT|nr:hypothetical protein DDZ15_05360 [Rhodohalobacter mucosus]